MEKDPKIVGMVGRPRNPIGKLNPMWDNEITDIGWFNELVDMEAITRIKDNPKPIGSIIFYYTDLVRETLGNNPSFYEGIECETDYPNVTFRLVSEENLNVKIYPQIFYKAKENLEERIRTNKNVGKDKTAELLTDILQSTSINSGLAEITVDYVGAVILQNPNLHYEAWLKVFTHFSAGYKKETLDIEHHKKRSLELYKSLTQ